jgi:HPt (histidine-containing phosphotransfer) domain-containing protein
MPDPGSTSFDPDEARRQVGDDEAILRDVIGLFIEDNPKREAELRRALERRDAELLERAAHTIKGSCVIFGAAAAREAAHALELLGRGRSFEGATEAIARLSKETERFSADFRSFLDASPA